LTSVRARSLELDLLTTARWFLVTKESVLVAAMT